jgi:cytochrome c-type biogenesis protein CcmH/NrfG
MGRYDDAAQSFSLAAGRGVPTPEILYALAEAEYSSGRPEAAFAAARKALTLDPGHQPSHRLLGRLELARQPSRITPR